MEHGYPLTRRAFVGFAGVAAATCIAQGPAGAARAWAVEDEDPAAAADQTGEQQLDPAWSEAFDAGFADTAWEGSGTKNDPWLIRTAAQLYGLALSISDAAGAETYRGKHFAQAADIDLAGREWIPLGNFEQRQVFCGHFDGRGFAVSNMTITRSRFGKDAHVSGLFGTLGEGALAENVNVSGTVRTSMSGLSVHACYVGGIAGLVAKGAAVRGCTSTLQVDAALRPAKADAVLGPVIVGGVAGVCRGAMSDCSAQGSLALAYSYAGGSAKELVGCVGGLAGRLEGGSVRNCSVYDMGLEARCAHANHASRVRLGGVAGEGVAAGSTIENCYAASLRASGSVTDRVEMDGETVAAQQGGTVHTGYLAGALDASSALSDAYFDESLGAGVPPVGSAAVEPVNVIQFTGWGENSLKQPSARGETTDLTAALNAWVGDQPEPRAYDVWLQRQGSYPSRTKIMPVGWGSVTYAAQTKDWVTPFYFDDALFAETSFDFQPSLATTSLALAMSAFNSLDVDYPERSRNVQAFMRDIGAKDIEVNEWYKVKPTTESIGVAVGHRSVMCKGQVYELLIVGVRGAGYEAEWYGNFLIGAQDDHAGFNHAADLVLGFVRDYAARHGEAFAGKSAKLWMAGFSRAAATSNVTGGRINKAGSGGSADGARDLSAAFDGRLSLMQRDAYIYCFEAPAGAYLPDEAARKSAKDDHRNIHSVINPCDLVPGVAPKGLRFGRYGQDLVLPSPVNVAAYVSGRDRMLPYFAELSNENTAPGYLIDGFRELGCGTMDVCLGAFFDIVARENLKSRKNYVDRYQGPITDLVRALMLEISIPPGRIAQVAKAFFKRFDAIALGKTYWYDDRQCTKTVALLRDWIVGAIRDGGGSPEGYEELIRQIIAELVPLLAMLALYHPFYLAALALSAGNVMSAHYPELCLAWLRSMDVRYGDPATPPAASGWDASYRIVRVNGAVDLSLHRDGAEPVALIAGEQVVSRDGAPYVAYVNPDGEKAVCLPVDDACSVVASAREDTTCSYAVNDIDFETGRIVNAINFYDHPMRQGDSLSGMCGSEGSFELRGSDGTRGLDPSFALSDAAEIEKGCYYLVEPRANDAGWGMVWGGGMRVAGAYAQLRADPAEGCRFEGWYVDGTRVSGDPVLRLRVEADVQPVAAFGRADGPNPPGPGPKPLVKTGDGVPAAAVAAVAATAGAVAVLGAREAGRAADDAVADPRR